MGHFSGLAILAQQIQVNARGAFPTSEIILIRECVGNFILFSKIMYSSCHYARSKELRASRAYDVSSASLVLGEVVLYASCAAAYITPILQHDPVSRIRYVSAYPYPILRYTFVPLIFAEILCIHVSVSFRYRYAYPYPCGIVSCSRRRPCLCRQVSALHLVVSKSDDPSPFRTLITAPPSLDLS